MKELVTIEEFIKQVWEVEHVKIQISIPENMPERLVRPYDFDPLPGDATVDDLKARINSVLNMPFAYIIN